ncbi:conserved domain protein [delta proteobacterium NaphS2]|nr:conserved domain protein [delta proteobacterium NaphS2]
MAQQEATIHRKISQVKTKKSVVLNLFSISLSSLEIVFNMY